MDLADIYTSYHIKSTKADDPLFLASLRILKYSAPLGIFSCIGLHVAALRNTFTCFSFFRLVGSVHSLFSASNRYSDRAWLFGSI